MQVKQSKLKSVRELEGWTITELAKEADISAATLKKAETGGAVRPHVWGKILKGINNLPNKNHVYAMSDIR
jgi:DNA-binding XRE family transcriptional regulator